jgi:hypothetical protein
MLATAQTFPSPAPRGGGGRAKRRSEGVRRMAACLDRFVNAARKTPSGLEDSATSPGGPGEGKAKTPCAQSHKRAAGASPRSLGRVNRTNASRRTIKTAGLRQRLVGACLIDPSSSPRSPRLFAPPRLPSPHAPPVIAAASRTIGWWAKSPVASAIWWRHEVPGATIGVRWRSMRAGTSVRSAIFIDRS